MRPQPGGAPVLLIDEIDRTDEPFEAFLLEALSDFQVTIPELGTIRAPEPPIVILTSNRTREVHDALKRRCLYHWVDYPSFDRELQILHRPRPRGAGHAQPRGRGLRPEAAARGPVQAPGVAETIDWAKCLLALDVIALSPEVISDTLGAILKYQDDIQKLQGSEAKRILDEVRASWSRHETSIFPLQISHGGAGGVKTPRGRAHGHLSRPRPFPMTASWPITSPISPAPCARRGCPSARAG
jgi:MoxR-like ATPase